VAVLLIGVFMVGAFGVRNAHNMAVQRERLPNWQLNYFYLVRSADRSLNTKPMLPPVKGCTEVSEG